MQLTTKIKNKSTTHSLLLKSRVGDVVISSGVYYVNISGINSGLDNADNWFKITGGNSPSVIDKLSSDIVGTSPDFYIDLSGLTLPDFPFMMIYVDKNGTNDFLPLSPSNYNPVTKILSGMNNPTDFNNQRVKILIL